MSSLDRYDDMTGRELKYEAKKRGLPLQQNKAAWKFRTLCRLDDQGKIPTSIKFLKPGTKKMPDFYDLLMMVNHVHSSSSQTEQDVLSESAQSTPSV
jgi:hypothetical protein